MVSMRWRTEGGPMPPNVVKPMGRGAVAGYGTSGVFEVFSVERVVMMARGSVAAVARYEGGRQLTEVDGNGRMEEGISEHEVDSCLRREELR